MIAESHADTRHRPSDSATSQGLLGPAPCSIYWPARQTSGMPMLINRLPTVSQQFASGWADDFQHELQRSALTRIRVVLTLLLFLEAGLILQDSYRTHWFSQGFDALTVWRLLTFAYLMVFRFLAAHWLNPAHHLRAVLMLGMFIGVYGAAVVAPQVGDLSIFTIVALGIAAASPLPGLFMSGLLVTAGLSLCAWLLWQVPESSQVWFVNILASTMLALALQKLSFANALEEFTQRKELELQRQERDRLLSQVFPDSVAESLKKGVRPVAMHGEVTILFADVVGFTRLSRQLLPSQLVSVLEDLFKRFDELAGQHGVEKIKTIGDAYMAVAGAPDVVDAPVKRMASFGLDLVQACQNYARECDLPLDLRVGIHCGPVVAGVIGTARLSYDLWGESVNTAKRIEASGQPSAVCVSEQVYFRLREQFEFERRGMIEAKGLGAIQTYLLLGPRPASDHQNR